MAVGVASLKKGNFIVIDKDPYVVLSLAHSHMGRGGAVFQTKVKNLRTGVILERNFRSGDSLEEAYLSKLQAEFIYERRGQYWFHETNRLANRFFIPSESLGGKAMFLKPGIEVTALKFERDNREEIINVELPVKADYKVVEAPPSIRGNTAEGGRKTATIEGGARVSVPLFIREGDTIRINIETGEYTERI